MGRGRRGQCKVPTPSRGEDAGESGSRLKSLPQLIILAKDRAIYRQIQLPNKLRVLLIQTSEEDSWDSDWTLDPEVPFM